MEKKSGIILALDVKDHDKALEIVKKLKNLIDAVKIGYPTVLENSMNIVDEISKTMPVICDFKVADIPNTNSLIAESVKKHGAEGLISHAFTGSDSLDAVIKSFYPGKVFAVVEMTHPGAVEFMQEVSLKLAKMAIEKGVSGFIVPGTRPERIKIYRSMSKEILLLAPGIGVQGGEAKRAIENGADYIIIGRSIYEAKDPVQKTKEIIESIS
ncbi:MAG: orotidine-5'-phosphate decarboxylase [Thermoplasmata archaeon]|nr:orotidine-5'-phosphate decarboxylase [Thermoplasmata archaeon]